jgi:hypothetical protein
MLNRSGDSGSRRIFKLKANLSNLARLFQKKFLKKKEGAHDVT